MPHSFVVNNLNTHFRQKLKNGVVTSVVDHVSPGATWHSPLHRSVHLSPPVCQLPAGAVSPQKDHSVSTHCQYVARNKEVDPSVPVPEAADNSPDNPKSFSQTGSPEPEQLKSDCPLMDEVDRGLCPYPDTYRILLANLSDTNPEHN